MTNNPLTVLATEISGLDRVRIFNASLDKLMSLYTNNSSSVEEFVECVTEETSRLLQVQRVSIWSFADNRKSILCQDLFELGSRKHSSGGKLSAEDFPDYFQAVLDSRVVDASNAAVDRRTCEFQNSYLVPNNILSMLDAQIRSAGGPRGVVCAESVGEHRDWTPDEIAFFVSIAELVGFAMDRRDRERVLTELEQKNRDLVTAKRKIEAISLEDPLTKLPNRRSMESFAESLLRETPSEHQEIAFLHIDLDKFKEINDRFGHSAGDHVLERIAATLRETVGEDQFVARTGGDEFVAIVTNQKSREDLVRLAEKMIGQLNLPILYRKQHCHVGASVGISFFDDKNHTAAQLLGNADIALYYAKRSGRNRVETFSSEMGLEAEARRKLHGEILEALEQGEFVPYFQPQFCASTLQLTGVEALVRWNHPVRGVLGPPAFLSAAEELGRVAEIDRLILEKSVAIVAEWERKGFCVPRLSVNVSSSRLNDSDLVETVESLNLQRNFLAFELLESTFLDETSQQVEQNLARLNDLGVEIEIDDFGTGYASLAGLLNIRPDRLKIDRQLIMDIEEDETMFELVKSVVVIADCMNIEAVAEGVETDKQIELLSEAGCQFLQGFKLGRPASADDIYARFSESVVEHSNIPSGAELGTAKIGDRLRLQ